MPLGPFDFFELPDILESFLKNPEDYFEMYLLSPELTDSAGEPGFSSILLLEIAEITSCFGWITVFISCFGVSFFSLRLILLGWITESGGETIFLLESIACDWE